jgi:hypothetical protein
MSDDVRVVRKDDLDALGPLVGGRGRSIRRAGPKPRPRVETGPTATCPVDGRRPTSLSPGRSTRRPSMRSMVVRASSSAPCSLCPPVKATTRDGASRPPARVTDNPNGPPVSARARRYDVPSQRSIAFPGRRRNAQTLRSSLNGGTGSIEKAPRHGSLSSSSPRAPPSFSHLSPAALSSSRIFSTTLGSDWFCTITTAFQSSAVRGAVPGRGRRRRCVRCPGRRR